MRAYTGSHWRGYFDIFFFFDFFVAIAYFLLNGDWAG
jgi:hypothetical protein